MVGPEQRERAQWSAELVRLAARRRLLGAERVWAQRAGTPRQAATLRRELARVERRMAHLRALLGLPDTPEGRAG